MPHRSNPASSAARLTTVLISSTPLNLYLLAYGGPSSFLSDDTDTESFARYASLMNLRSMPLVLPLAVFSIAALCAQQPVVITISDPLGAPVPGAQIRVVPAPDPEVKMDTDGKGQLALKLKPGGYALFGRAQGFRRLEMHFDVQDQMAPIVVKGVLQVATYSGPTVVSPASSKDDLVVLAYPYHQPAAFSTTEIKAMAHTSVIVHNPHANADETYSGVRLADLLTKLGAPLGKELRGEALALYVVAKALDGYAAVLSLAEIDPEFHSGEVIVADAMNDKPLDPHSGPLKLVVTEDKRPARCVRNLNEIDVASAR